MEILGAPFQIITPPPVTSGSMLRAGQAADVLQLGGVSCLFNTSAPVKSSREVVCKLARELLSGEGDVIR